MENQNHFTHSPTINTKSTSLAHNDDDKNVCLNSAAISFVRRTRERSATKAAFASSVREKANVPLGGKVQRSKCQ